MLNPNHSTLALVLALTFLLGLESRPTTNPETHNPNNKVNVTIENLLDSALTIQVHCKDKHTDLGIHYIPVFETYQFMAKKPFFGSALFFCGFVFEDVLHWFDIYVQKRDTSTCGSQCYWVIVQDGPCLASGPHYKCFPWNPKPVYLNRSNLDQPGLSP